MRAIISLVLGIVGISSAMSILQADEIELHSGVKKDGYVVKEIVGNTVILEKIVSGATLFEEIELSDVKRIKFSLREELKKLTRLQEENALLKKKLAGFKKNEDTKTEDSKNAEPKNTKRQLERRKSELRTLGRRLGIAVPAESLAPGRIDRTEKSLRDGEKKFADIDRRRDEYYEKSMQLRESIAPMNPRERERYERKLHGEDHAEKDWKEVNQLHWVAKNIDKITAEKLAQDEGLRKLVLRYPELVLLLYKELGVKKLWKGFRKQD